MTSHLVSDFRVHGTGLRCTSFHRFQATAVFYPIFYPKRYLSEVEIRVAPAHSRELEWLTGVCQ
jgi:hypothetical protein